MLHIVNGLSTLNLLDRTDIRGARVSGDDIFAEGPIVDRLENESAWKVRAEHLQERFKIPQTEYMERRAERERNLRSAAYHEEIILWFEFDLFCQMNLLYLLHWFAQHDLGNSRLSLICPGTFSGIKQFRGLGSLTPKQLTSLFPTRAEVTIEQKVLACKSWDAYSSPDPTKIEQLVEEGTEELPHLRGAFFAHLERFPSKKNGLNHVETRTLELIADAPWKFPDLFSQVTSSEKVLSHGMGDMQFSVHLAELSEAENPLLRVENCRGLLGGETGKNLAKCNVRITEFGRDALDGKVNVVEANGIDRWLGGVHLKSGERLWWWDEDKHRLFSDH